MGDGIKIRGQEREGDRGGQQDRIFLIRTWNSVDDNLMQLACLHVYPRKRCMSNITYMSMDTSTMTEMNAK